MLDSLWNFSRSLTFDILSSKLDKDTGRQTVISQNRLRINLIESGIGSWSTLMTLRETRCTLSETLHDPPGPSGPSGYFMYLQPTSSPHLRNEITSRSRFYFRVFSRECTTISMINKSVRRLLVTRRIRSNPFKNALATPPVDSNENMQKYSFVGWRD